MSVEIDMLVVGLGERVWATAIFEVTLLVRRGKFSDDSGLENGWSVLKRIVVDLI